MRDFFRGWKPKAGCVTLVMACVFTSAWIRSLSHCDCYQFPGEDPAFHVIYSVPNGVGWVTEIINSPNQISPVSIVRSDC